MSIELAPGFYLRRATAADHAGLLSVCLKTGDSGADATGSDPDGDLVGLYYAVPYQVLEPRFCFVITYRDAACGYVMGTPDTREFDRRFTAEWLPALRARTKPPADNEQEWKGFDWLRHRIHSPDTLWFEALEPYPAQGHIDLLSHARGQGVGQAAMLHLMGQLSAAGARGLHLHVSPQNTGAQIFYRKLGFHILRDAGLPSHTVFMARPLP